MRKTSKITQVSILLALFFGLDKGLGILRQLIIGREFGLSKELDVFNAANNLPDLLFALISGGALAIAIIPVLSEILSKKGQLTAWRVFSNILNIAFLITSGVSIVVALIAEPLVKSQIGIAPGFSLEQQGLTVSLMRLNLIATIIFSISGLIMAGLQANQHFLFPALAPVFYDLGQIFGAVILAPAQGIQIGILRLPAFDLGIRGLVYGVIIGAVLHLLIQIPGLIKHHFNWTAKINFMDSESRKIFKLMGPRLISVFAFQLIFLAQDNLASRLQTGSVTALTYGWLIMQVPETLIGTAIATALLPTLSEYAVQEKWDAYMLSISKAIQGIVVLTLPITAILALGLSPIIQIAFNFSQGDTNYVVFVTQAFLLGLSAHSLVELLVRSFYARQKAIFPMLGSLLSLFLFIVVALLLMKPFAAAGIAAGNSLAYIAQMVFLFWTSKVLIMNESKNRKVLIKSIFFTVSAGFLVWFIQYFGKNSISPLFLSLLAISVGVLFTAVVMRKELRAILQL